MKNQECKANLARKTAWCRKAKVSVPPKNESQEIRFFGKIGFLKFPCPLKMSQEIRFFGKIGFLNGMEFSAFVY
ncbi:MAG: hypothetical protein DRR19_14060 [Candidatus Parabeggiatoa sp. nov. 1]|nr:MAG: hypothetical protein DRR19_14060 [Gammaproteobacteria bacterium]